MSARATIDLWKDLRPLNFLISQGKEREKVCVCVCVCMWRTGGESVPSLIFFTHPNLDLLIHIWYTTTFCNLFSSCVMCHACNCIHASGCIRKISEKETQGTRRTLILKFVCVYNIVQVVEHRLLDHKQHGAGCVLNLSNFMRNSLKSKSKVMELEKFALTRM